MEVYSVEPLQLNSLGKVYMNKSTNTKKPRNANGDGTLYFDESCNKWRCQVSYNTPSGERKRKSFTGKTKTEVKNQKKKFLQDVALGRITDTSDCTAVDLLQESADYDYNFNIIQEAAYTRRLDTIRIIRLSAIGNVPLVKLNEAKINAFLLDIKSRYSNSTIGKVYSALSKAYKLAIDKKLLTYNLMDSPFIKRPKADKKDRKVFAFTCEEENIFLEALKHKKYKANSVNYVPLYLIELFAGLRMGEICALEKTDIDLEKNVIKVRNTVTRGLNYEVKIGDRTKTPRGVRDVPINPYLKNILKDVLDNYEDNKDNLLFYNKTLNRPVSTEQANNAFKRLCKSAGLKISGGQHLLRHTFATRCIEAEVPAEVLMRWMGHQDISITINTYCDVFAKMHNKAIDKFSAYCNENLSA